MATRATGLSVADHVIINGGKYYSMRESKMVDFDARALDAGRKAPVPHISKAETAALPANLESQRVAAWELVPRDEFAQVRDSASAGKIFSAMQSGGQHAVNVLLLGRKYNVIGALAFDADATTEEIMREVKLDGSKHGASAAVVDIPRAGLEAIRIARELAEDSKAGQVWKYWTPRPPTNPRLEGFSISKMPGC